MAPPIKDLTGRPPFGKLTVRCLHPDRIKVHGSYIWICDCECGGVKEASQAALMRGDVQSCGCLVAEGKRYQQIQTVCGFCQKPFKAKTKRTRFCSTRCKFRHRRKAASKRLCQICGKPLIVTGKKRPRVTCSEQCKRIRDAQLALARHTASIAEQAAIIAEKVNDGTCAD